MKNFESSIDRPANGAALLHQAISDVVEERGYTHDEYDRVVVIARTTPESGVPEPVQHIFASIPPGDHVSRTLFLREITIEKQFGGLPDGYETSTVAYARHEESEGYGELTEVRIKYFAEDLGDSETPRVTRLIEGVRCPIDAYQKFQEDRPPYIDQHDGIFYVGAHLAYDFSNAYVSSNPLERSTEVDVDEVRAIVQSLYSSGTAA